MGLRETTNFYGGLGHRGSPAMTPLVDKTIGNAFPVVRCVADNMDAVRYVADNMEAIVKLARSQAEEITALREQVATLTAMVVPATPTIVARPLSISMDRGDE